MLLSSLLLIPIFGVVGVLAIKVDGETLEMMKSIALTASVCNLSISFIVFILFDFSTNQFQFVQEYHEISYFDLYLGVDGLSIYFILLTTIIMPISILSHWRSISKEVASYVIIILILETLLLAVFLVLDILLFYIFFESILPPLFVLIGLYGSDNRVKASFYLFLYTLLGSLFLLLAILAMSSIISTTDFDTIFKGNFVYLTQLSLFYGIFIAFAVKTPTIFLNTWLLKAHVESPLGGSIILAAIVLKLSLYGIFRLILPVLPKAYMDYTYIIYLIGVITIIYASLSTLRTIDVKELIAYSSVSHAAVYLLGVFSNSLQGIEGGINLGLAHGLVSPGLFICAGGVLYDRSHTRLIAFYRGVAQLMPLFAILFFILCLANCGAPLSLNFIGEFLSLYGVFERSSLYGVFASSSIVFSAAYTMYMYQKISFGGAFSRMFTINIPDLNKREFLVLLSLVVPTVIFGIYPAPILDGLHYSVTTLIYSFDLGLVNCDAPRAWGIYFQDSASLVHQFEITHLFKDISLLANINLSITNIGLYMTIAAFLVFYFSILATNHSVITKFFSDYLRIIKDKCAPILEWVIHNPPKPHEFTSLPIESSFTGGPENPNDDGSPTGEDASHMEDVVSTEDAPQPSDEEMANDDEMDNDEEMANDDEMDNDEEMASDEENNSDEDNPSDEENNSDEDNPSDEENNSGDDNPTEDSANLQEDLDKALDRVPTWLRDQMRSTMRLYGKLAEGNISQFESKAILQQNQNMTEQLSKLLEEQGATERDLKCLQDNKDLGDITKTLLKDKHPSYNLDSHWSTDDNPSQAAQSSSQADQTTSQPDQSSAQADQSSAQADQSSSQANQSAGQADQSSSQANQSAGQADQSSAENSDGVMKEAKDELDKSVIGILITPSSRILWIALSFYLNPLRPYLIVITPLILSALVYFNLFYISELYTMLINVAGVYVGSIIVILCTVLHFLVKMLLMIRRANNSVGLYYRLVNFVANSSFVMYSLILLVSVVIVYYSGDLSVF